MATQGSRRDHKRPTSTEGVLSTTAHGSAGTHRAPAASLSASLRLAYRQHAAQPHAGTVGKKPHDESLRKKHPKRFKTEKIVEEVDNFL